MVWLNVSTRHCRICLSNTLTKKRNAGKNILIPASLHTTLLNMIHLGFLLMFLRKAVLPIDINAEAKDAEIMLDNLKATDDSDKSADGIAAHTKLLEEAKANIVKAQKKQKQYYDKKHCIKGMHICM